MMTGKEKMSTIDLLEHSHDRLQCSIQPGRLFPSGLSSEPTRRLYGQVGGNEGRFNEEYWRETNNLKLQIKTKTSKTNTSNQP